MDVPDLLERLSDFHNYGMTHEGQFALRREALDEIKRLRSRVDALEELNRIRVHQINVRPG